MRCLLSFAAAALLLGAASAVAQDGADARHRVADGNNWWISDSACLLDAAWEDGFAVLVNPHEAHYDLGLYNSAFTNVTDGETIAVRIAAGNDLARDTEATGHLDGKERSYVAAVDDELLDAIGGADAMQFFRGGDLLADLDMTGFASAVATMRECAAKRGDPAFRADDVADPLEDAAKSVTSAADAAAAAAEHSDR